jgi:hypothetical protein
MSRRRFSVEAISTAFSAASSLSTPVSAPVVGGRLRSPIAFRWLTACAYTRWQKVEDPRARLMIQGANPWSDLHARGNSYRISGIESGLNHPD